MSPVAPTRRALVLAFYGDLLVLTGALSFLALRRPAALVVGFLLGGVLAIPSLALVWRGRHDFGGVHARYAPWGLSLFVVAAVAYVVAFLALASTFPERGQLATLRIALFLLAIGLVGENLSGISILWNLPHDTKARRYIVAQLATVAILVGGLLYRGLGTVNDLVRRSGGLAINAAEARSYLADFNATVLVDFVAVLLLAHVPALLALWRHVDALARLERPETASSTAPVA